MKHLALSIIFSLFACAAVAVAQEQPVIKPTAEEIEKQKEEWTKNAYRLLDQVLDESQSLRLPENRVRIQILAADMLWDRDEGRARTMFTLAGDTIAEMLRTPETTGGSRQNRNRVPTQLRQDLVLTAARHDATLAYQLLATTKPPAPTQNPSSRLVEFNREDSLEQNLLYAIAARDPKLAAQNADQLLDKGEFPSSLSEVINQLRKQDEEAAAKLADKTVKRLQAANMMNNSEATSLAMGLLSAGPRVETREGPNNATPTTQRRGPVLDQSMYVDLLGSVIDSALRATPQTQTGQRPGAVRRPAARRPATNVQIIRDGTPSEAQMEQANARRLLSGLQRLLPQIDQNLPTRSQAVRQKLSETGLGENNPRTGIAQAMNSLQGGGVEITADSLMQAAASSPAQIQSRLYQQAAFKALEEGNVDRARQIATDHLDVRQRDSVMRRIDFRELATRAQGARIEEVRQSLARLQTDSERIDLLIQLAADLATSNPKLQRQLLEEASQMTNKRATSYEHFALQLRVAHAYASVDPARSFEILDPGISHLNELMSAAALLSGFETNAFRDGELPLQGGSSLTAMINRFGQEIALLARSDFDRSETLAGRFQFPESRIMAKVAIVQGLLGVRSQQQNNNFFRIGENFTFTARP